MDSSADIEYIDTFYAPSPEEIRQIRSYIEESEDALQALDEKEFEEGLSRLDISQKKMHLQRISDCKALISPVLLIPNDILSYIFLTLCLEAGDDAMPSIDHPSIVVTHVCRQWRQLAISTPTLWSFINVKAVPTYPPDRLGQGRWQRTMQTRTNALAAFISRGGSCLISLRFETRVTTGEGRVKLFPSNSLPQIKEFMQVVCGSSRRWGSAFIWLHVSSRNKPFFSIATLSPEDLPLLRKLELKVTITQRTAVTFQPSDIQLLSALPLRSVSLPSFWTGRVLDCSAKWSQITDLSVGQDVHEGFSDHFNAYPIVKPSGALELLRACPNLIRFKLVSPHLALWLQPVFRNQNIPRVTLLYLEELTFVGLDNWKADTFPAFLTLPSLRKLSLSFSRTIPKTGTTKIRIASDWLGRFGEQLVDVTLNYVCFQTSVLRDCLECLPNIVNLTISDFPGVVNSLLEYLTPKPADSTEPFLCHQLRFFNCQLDEKRLGIPDPACSCDDCCFNHARMVYEDVPDIQVSEEALLRFLVGRRTVGDGAVHRLIEGVRMVLSCKRTVDIEAELERRGIRMPGRLKAIHSKFHVDCQVH